jgi:polyisoprenoid-binding protein YceI
MFVSKSLRLLVCASFALAALSARAAETYVIDTAHSSVSFKIRHILTMVPGSFPTFEGMVRFDPEDPSAAYAEATIDLTSIDTGNDDRDAHLQQDDYFHTAEYPKMTFKSTKWVPVKNVENVYKVHGELSMRGETHPVTLTATFIGQAEHPRNQKALVAFSANGTIERTKWGVDGGQGVVGNDVEFEINIEAYEKTEEG